MAGEIPEELEFDLTLESSATYLLPTAIDFDMDEVTVEVTSDAEFVSFDAESNTILFEKMQKGKYEV